LGFDGGDKLPRGFLLGSVELLGCTPTEDLVNAVGSDEKEFGLWDPGRFAWECGNPVILQKPVAVRGLPGFFAVDDDQVPDELR